VSERRPHVLQVLQPTTGGVPRYVANLSVALLERGWRVTVACPTGCVGADELRDAGAQLLDLDVGRAPHPFRDVRAVGEITSACVAGGVDVLHGHSTKAGMLVAAAARRAGVPSVYTPHGWSFEMRVSGVQRAAYALLERGLGRHCHAATIAVCGAERAAAERWHVMPRGRVRVVPTGLPEAPSPPPSRTAARAMLGLPPDGLIVGWVGRIGAQKRPQDLAPLARALDSDALVVALCDRLDEEPRLARELAAAGVVVLADGTDVRELYAAADLFAQTSAWEGLPLVVLEAMIAGLPVVAYDSGGVREQVQEAASGHLVRSGDVNGLGARLRALAADDSARLRMARAARERVVERFSFGAMVGAVEQTYLAACDAPLPATPVHERIAKPQLSLSA